MRSDTDRTPSPSPNAVALPKSISSAPRGVEMDLNGHKDDSPGLVPRGRPYSLVTRPDRLVYTTRVDYTLDISMPAPPGIGHPIIPMGNVNGNSNRRSRPETSHQKAVNMNRKMRIDHILHKQMLEQHHAIRKAEKRESSSFGFMAMRRIQELPNDYDTESESSWGPGGLVPNPGEKEDFGGAALRAKKVLDRAMRRLLREENGGSLAALRKGYRKRKRKDSAHENSAERSSAKQSHHGGRHETREDRNRNGERQEGLDDLDLDLLGESRDDDHHVEDEVDESPAVEESDGEGDDATEDDMTHEG